MCIEFQPFLRSDFSMTQKNPGAMDKKKTCEDSLHCLEFRCSIKHENIDIPGVVLVAMERIRNLGLQLAVEGPQARYNFIGIRVLLS